MLQELRVMAAVGLHLNARYPQHFALKSVYDKRQNITAGKLFSSRAVFELARL